MTLYVVRNPRPDTIATVSETPTGAPGEETMSEAAFIAWRDSQQVAKPSPPPPQIIPLFKLKLWLLAAGKLAAVEAMLANAAAWPTPEEHTAAKILWAHRDNVLRTSQLVNSLGAALGMTQAEIDAAFIAADAIE